jgi:tetratricopeptide (TPR) repeat protein
MSTAERPAAAPPASQPPAAGPAPFDIVTGETSAPVVQFDDAQRAEQMYREGLKRFENRDLMGAIQLWRDAVRLAPANPEYNKRLGLALSRNARWHKEAEKHLLAAMTKDALNAELTNALGNIYVEAGLKKRAESQFRKVLAYSPGNKDAIKGLADLGIEYDFLGRGTSKGAKAVGAKAATASGGSFLSKIRPSQSGGEEKEGVDMKVIALVIVGALVLFYLYLSYLGLV